MTSTTKNTEATQPQPTSVADKQPIQIFSSPFNLGRYCVVRDDDELKQLCKEINCDEKVFGRLTTQAAQTALIRSEEGVGLSVVRMNLIQSEDSRVSCMTTLVHECVHVVQNLMEAIGEEHPSREFQAYMTEQVFENLVVEYFRDDKEITKSLIETEE